MKPFVFPQFAQGPRCGSHLILLYIPQNDLSSTVDVGQQFASFRNRYHLATGINDWKLLANELIGDSSQFVIHDAHPSQVEHRYSLRGYFLYLADTKTYFHCQSGAVERIGMNVSTLRPNKQPLLDKKQNGCNVVSMVFPFRFVFIFLVKYAEAEGSGVANIRTECPNNDWSLLSVSKAIDGGDEGDSVLKDESMGGEIGLLLPADVSRETGYWKARRERLQQFLVEVKGTG